MKPTLTYVSLFSGIEACSVAMSRITDVNWKPVFFSEIDPFPCAVLAHHFPDVPNLGDVTQIKVNKERTEITNGRTTIPFPGVGIDLLAGGSPCQDCSLAGKRAGMAEGSGTRSALAFEYARLVEELRPRILVWENVMGVLSSNEGRDFLAFQDSLVERGYSLAWRVLDAQFTTSLDFPRAIPQRRKRVWLVGCLGADESVPAEILFERTGMLGDSPPRREAGKGSSSPAGYRLDGDDRVVGAPRGTDTIGINELLGGGGVAPTLFAGMSHQWGSRAEFTKTGIVSIGKEAYNMGDAAQGSMNISEDDSAQTMRADTHPSAVAILDMTHADEVVREVKDDAAPTMQARMGTDCNQVPLVQVATGFMIGPSSKTGSIGAQVEQSPTLDTSGAKGVAIGCFNMGGNKASAGTDMTGASPSILAQHGTDPHAVAIGIDQQGGKSSAASAIDVSPTMLSDSHGTPNAVAILHIVRRLTPTEAERLMGFPDGWTNIPWKTYQEADRKGVSYERLLAERGMRLREPTTEECPDSPRYKALGNSFTTNCAEWILRRIVATDQLGLIP